MGLLELIAQLKAAGAAVVPGARVNQPFIDVAGDILSVNGEQIQVYEYASVLDASNEAARVAPDGTSFSRVSSSDGSGSAYQVDWVKPPHLYTTGRIIVIYIGMNQSLMCLLTGILGMQFAGM